MSPVLRRVAVAAGAIGIALATLVGLGDANARRAFWPPEADTLDLPGSAVLGVASLGHREMMGALIAVRTNVYFGTQIHLHGPHRHLQRFLNTVSDLDPRFQRMYLQGATMLIYTGRRITVDMVLAACDYLERGRREFPGDWELAFQEGFNLLFELPAATTEDDPRLPLWRQRGVDALREASLLEGAPSWLADLAHKMLTKVGRDEMALRSLEQAYAAARTDAVREEIGRKLVSLKAGRAVEDMRRALDELESLRARRYPFAPEAFSIVAGERPALGVDLPALTGTAPRAVR